MKPFSTYCSKWMGVTILLSLCMIGSLANADQQRPQPPALVEKSIKGLIEEIQEIRAEGEFAVPADVDVYRRQLRGTIDAGSACLAAVQLAALGEHDQIELEWWRSEIPIVRAVCAACLLMQKTGEIPLSSIRQHLSSSLMRFSAKEEQARKGEIGFVYEHRDLLKTLLKHE